MDDGIQRKRFLTVRGRSGGGRCPRIWEPTVNLGRVFAESTTRNLFDWEKGKKMVDAIKGCVRGSKL